jgi:hypothetical protein
MKNLLLFLITIVFLISCKTSNIKENEFRIIGLRHHANTNTDDELFIIKSSDIVCVDWKNQSFKISEKILNQIKDENKFTGGFINEYLNLEFNGRILTSVNIHNLGSSTRYFVKNSPNTYIFTSTNTIFNPEGWLIINPFNLSENSIYAGLYSDSVFHFFKNKTLLTGSSWECQSNIQNDTLSNLTNRNFTNDFNNKFNKEIKYKY